MLYRRSRVALLIGLLLLPICCHASTPQVPARPDAPVVDLAEVLNIRVEQQLITVLNELRDKTGDRLVILTLHSLDGEDIVTFAQHIVRQWFSGEADSNGMLLLVMSLQEELYSIERSQVLEEVLPDSRITTIGEETLEPLFNKGKHGAAITAAASEIIEVLQSHHGISLAGSEKLAKVADSAGKQFPWQVVFILMMIYVVLRMRGRKKE